MGLRERLGLGQPVKEDSGKKREHEAQVREMRLRLRTLQAQLEVMRRAQG